MLRTSLVCLGKKVVDPTGAESNRLFEVFQEWEHHLAPYDLSDLRCGDEHLR